MSTPKGVSAVFMPGHFFILFLFLKIYIDILTKDFFSRDVEMIFFLHFHFHRTSEIRISDKS